MTPRPAFALCAAALALLAGTSQAQSPGAAGPARDQAGDAQTAYLDQRVRDFNRPQRGLPIDQFAQRVSRAVLSNPSTLAGRSTVGAAGQAVLEAKAAALPQISGQIDGTARNTDGSVVLNTPKLRYESAGAGLSLRQSLFDFGATQASIDAAREREACHRLTGAEPRRRSGASLHRSLVRRHARTQPGGTGAAEPAGRAVDAGFPAAAHGARRRPGQRCAACPDTCHRRLCRADVRALARAGQRGHVPRVVPRGAWRHRHADAGGAEPRRGGCRQRRDRAQLSGRAQCRSGAPRRRAGPRPGAPRRRCRNSHGTQRAASRHRRLEHAVQRPGRRRS